MSQVLEVSLGWVLFFLCFAFISFFVSKIWAGEFNKTKVGLLVANRSLSGWEAAFSIAASWIWAPALFISSQKAYQDGVLGLFWFVAPNVFCLVLFAFFAQTVRREFPEGFTLSGYIRSKTSERVQILYWIALTGLALCAFAVQLLAGGQFLAKITGWNYTVLTIILAAIPLTYSLVFGLKATIVTDLVKMLIIYSFGFLLIPLAVSKAGGWEVMVNGFGGVNQIHEVTSEKSWRLFLTFGLPTTIGLLSGPFGDQTFWQRLFAIQQTEVRSVFFRGAALFAVVPLLLASLGFLAAGREISVVDPQLVNLDVIREFLPTWGEWAFSILVMSGLISILDSKLAAIGSLSAHDWVQRALGPNRSSFSAVVTSSRLGMLGLAFGAILIANIPGLKILHLFLFYGTLRSSTLLPTMLLIRGVRLQERGVFWGILSSILIGLPIFAYGNLMGQVFWIVAGSLMTVLLSGLIALLVSWKGQSFS